MRFEVNDRVKLTEDADFGTDHLIKGTAGRVTRQLPLSIAYRVMFDGLGREVIALDVTLEAE